ncbi:MAG: hypothetical protein GX994_05885 [Firmicutes bacterium]|mgnify:CR=1 FL=1|nr:hypothetical protein [Bacillota bacterium]
MAKETIKSRVIQTVYDDPFLSIDEIADKVTTTPRYVRTILSEAGLSLMQLRKQYAKAMEKQLGSRTLIEEVRQYEADLKLTKIKDPAAARLLKQASDVELMQVSRVEKLGRIPIYIELTTYLELRLADTDGPLSQLLILPQNGEIIKQKHSWIEVVANNSAISKLLVNSENQPLLKLSYLLYQDSIPIALKTQWLQTEGILLKTDTGKFEIAAEV